MKKITFGIVAVSAIVGLSGALAADLPGRRQPPAPSPYLSPVPAFSWTGFYAGVNGGYGFGKFTKGGKFDFGSANGGMFGVTAGYNYQVAPNFVLGVEGDYDWASLSGARTNVVGLSTISARSRLNSIGSLRGRAGYAVDRALLYVTGGIAGGNIKSSLNAIGPAATGADSSFRTGYVLGAGIEYAFTNNISAKAEYTYTSFSSKGMFPAPYSIQTGLNVSAVKAGLNYHF